MRIALLQINAHLAEPERNGSVIEASYREAIALGAELVLTPEMALPGYLAEDRLLEAGMRRRIEAESRRLEAAAGPVPLVFGTCSPAPSGRLWNELWWCEDGRERTRCRKRILAEYDVFDEGRYFEADPLPQPLVDKHQGGGRQHIRYLAHQDEEHRQLVHDHGDQNGYGNRHGQRHAVPQVHADKHISRAAGQRAHRHIKAIR